ncbi:MAG: hypothetical protein IRY99_24035 [Isosphaeraceae bacterium]|nr:hypothetical protein [Isosphaeraceae bacterium]
MVEIDLDPDQTVDPMRADLELVHQHVHPSRDECDDREGFSPQSRLDAAAPWLPVARGASRSSPRVR